MKKVTPAEMIKITTEYADNLDALAKKAVFVGLPKEKVGGKIYGDGMSIIRVGAIHEFGYKHIPQRSFLRTPFKTQMAAINKATAAEFEAILTKGRKAEQALGRIGVIATNISKGAFRSGGYGQWPGLKASTIRAKGSGTPLIDTGTLRSSITWVVRDAS
jgi:phage gpG-like protein